MAVEARARPATARAKDVVPLITWGRRAAADCARFPEADDWGSVSSKTMPPLPRLASLALVVIASVIAPIACGFPDYGGFEASSASSGGTGGSGQGGAGGTTTTSSAGGGGAGGTGAGGGGGAPGCTTNADCDGSPLGPVCDPQTAACVACLPSDDVCAAGQYCTPAKTCVPGCNDDTDCNLASGTGAGGGGGSGGAGGAAGAGGAGPASLTCDVASHVCIGCVIDDPCPPGTICDTGTTECIPGCTPKHDCQVGHDCCSGECVDLQLDAAHCGACDTPCDPPGGTGQCAAGVCQLLSCDPTAADCDADPANGCESDPAVDAANCGGCGLPCAPMANAQPGCSGGVCALGPCLAGYADCDMTAATGCEINILTSVGNCGGCGAACNLANAVEACQSGVCAVQSCEPGFANCDATSSNGCEVSTQTDTQNCGACDASCSLPNASPVCQAGSCAIAQCAPPFDDCNLVAGDGCETNLNTSLQSCGACGTLCNLPNATAACSNGGCVVASCNSGFQDCDGLPANGCEINTNTNALNCGGCGAACSTNNGTPSCGGGQCSITCLPGFANCDGSAANGCEINTTNNVNNCSSCGNVCPPQGGTPACSNSQCTVSSCAPGKGDCDGNTLNGCETTTTTDVDNCGGCGLACFVQNGTAGCAGSTCFVASCNPGFANCDGLYANGCETNLHTLADCGACGVGCNLANATSSCATGTCGIVSCAGTFADCDGTTANGCEVNTASNIANCGTCGNACSAVNGSPSCSGGACSITCAAGFGNCDSNVGNGCETATTNNVNACGGCGNVCAVQNGTPGCSGTTCVVQSCTGAFKNCNGLYGDGCEVNSATSLTNCGTCGTACANANGTTSCSSGVCSPVCAPGFASCDSNPNNGCETNTNTSLTNCGGCGTTCSYANGVGACQNGTCALVSCNASFGDCDLNPANGCETPLNTLSNCGACGVACSNGNGMTACAAGVCSPTCNAGFASCDANPNNGCETSTTTVANCGGCGVPCDFANATESCPGGACTFGVCNGGFGNCDGSQANGCETDTNTSNQHCGGCNAPCPGGKFCAAGTCVDACPPGTADCDGNSANGCETNTNTDANHCGACPTVCSSSQYCAVGSCTACGAGLRDCDKNGANGCEVNVAGDPNNCGACGTKCGSDGTCGCAASMCSGGTISFSEDFSDNAKGWTLDVEWQIGPATASSGQEQGNPDPASDHTTSADNGVAGITIGGNYIVSPQHGFYYLTSPIIDLSGAPGTVLLSYWRWLNTDWDPYTVDTVEVFNGSSWVTLWANTSLGSVFVTDAAWTRFEHNVTSYKNASFRVRFGFKTGKQGNFLPWIMSGWNIDDVSLASATCN